jgi:hypothetical protein
MTIGIKLSTDDLQAIAKLYEVRWAADIRSWKERDTDYCLWLVSCPNHKNSWITRSGTSLAEIITKLLKELDL